MLQGFNVALLAEGVDRNICQRVLQTVSRPVALLAEGVDRNTIISQFLILYPVALLAEGVDRNHWNTMLLIP